MGGRCGVRSLPSVADAGSRGGSRPAWPAWLLGVLSVYHGNLHSLTLNHIVNPHRGLARRMVGSAPVRPEPSTGQSACRATSRCRARENETYSRWRHVLWGGCACWPGGGVAPRVSGVTRGTGGCRYTTHRRTITAHPGGRPLECADAVHVHELPRGVRGDRAVPVPLPGHAQRGDAIQGLGWRAASCRNLVTYGPPFWGRQRAARWGG